MKIIIVGAGRIGLNLARSLSEENHEVYLIEKNEEIAGKANEKIDVKVICGSGADPDVLFSAQVDKSDLVIAVTMSDEVNLVVCSLAASFGAKRKIARVRNPSLGVKTQEGYEKYFYVDEIINPEELSACAIERAIDAPGSREVGDFADGRILLRAFDIQENSTLCSLKISDFSDEDFPWPFIVTAIIRNGTVVIPKGHDVIQAGDKIYVLLPTPSLPEFLSYVHPEIAKPHKVIVYGATKTGEHVVNALSDHIQDIVLIEENRFLAQQTAQRLHSRVINGCASEKDILKEAGIEAADVFVSATDNDHSNLISAVLAKRMGAKATMIVTQLPDYTSIVGAMDIDVIINPHMLAVDQILRLVRGKTIHAVTKLLECDTEVLEFVPEDTSPITKAPLKEIIFPKNSLVGAVCREDGVVLARGDTQIRAGEKVIVFCQRDAVKKLQDLFTNRRFF